ncbi:hypothetical protein [Pseudomonas syringae]|uniref:Uncharacterized protein n=1 Tax=Pseudomonas syringae CC1417 TaxID=1357272 RepID=A0AAU8LGC5_PSESX
MKDEMKKLFVATILLAAGVVHAEIPSGMPKSSSEMTFRDICFQSLRGHADQAASKKGDQITRMIEGYGGEEKSGDYKCAARFELTTSEGEGKRTPWSSYTVFINDQLSDSQKSMSKAVNGL